MNHLPKYFKCSFNECQYGTGGSKSFKKETYLQQHLKNVHEEKTFECSQCHKRFAFEWQLKYHGKYCGTELRCTACPKVYSNPMSLVMHCKRTLHPLPSDQHFKFRSFNCSPKNYSTCVLVPMFIYNNSSLWKNKFILPKLEHQPDRHTKLNEEEILPPTKTVKKRTRDEIIMNDNKRSTDSQTVRKRNRAAHKHESKSIQTQTLHSSFDSSITETCQNSFSAASAAKKCSSFTQTLLDHIDDQNEYIVKDAFLSNEPSQLEQSVQTEFVPLFENCNTIETQTNTATTTTTTTEFNSESLPTSISVSSGDEEQFQFSDLEFIDIETQTIWNYDRTTQTENDKTFENWIRNNVDY